MLLTELFEMIMRTGGSIPALDSYDINNISTLDYKYVGVMQHGYSVFVAKHAKSLIYIIKNSDNVIMSMVQVKKVKIPKIGIVYEVLNSKTDPNFTGNLLNYKLKYFLVHHLGYKLLAGNVHSSATEHILPKMIQYFDMMLVNVISGEQLEWTHDNYLKTSHIGKVTNWQTLFLSSHSPLKESMPNLPGFDNSRHLWTYAEHLFDECKQCTN